MNARPITPAITPIRMRLSRAYEHAEAIVRLHAGTSDQERLLAAANHAATTGHRGQALRASAKSTLLPEGVMHYREAILGIVAARNELRSSERLAVALA